MGFDGDGASVRYALEKKSEQFLDGYFDCSCEKPATRLIEIGLEGFVHGKFFRICHSEDCLEACFDEVQEEILFGKNYEPDMEELRKIA